MELIGYNNKERHKRSFRIWFSKLPSTTGKNGNYIINHQGIFKDHLKTDKK